MKQQTILAITLLAAIATGLGSGYVGAAIATSEVRRENVLLRQQAIRNTNDITLLAGGIVEVGQAIQYNTENMKHAIRSLNSAADIMNRLHAERAVEQAEQYPVADSQYDQPCGENRP